MIKTLICTIFFLLLQPFSIQAETESLDADKSSPPTSTEKLSAADFLMDKGIASHKLNTKEGLEKSVIYFSQSAEMGNANSARILYFIYIT
jgi:hypothetical protein